MAFKFLLGILFTSTAFAQLRTTDFQQSLNANAPRNYMLNGHFEKNEVGVTDVSNIATRVTTTPLEGVGELNINSTATSQIVYLEAEAIQPGLEGQTCEASFVYTGDASLYTAYAYGVAKLSDTVTLQNVGTNAQTVSLIFPCYPAGGGGAFVAIESTGDGAAINIDSVYLGKALNIGTVAQAESVVRAFRNSTTQAIGTTAATKVQFNAETFDVYNEFDIATNYRYTAKRAGKYKVSCTLQLGSATSNDPTLVSIYKNGSEYSTYRTTYAGTTSGASCPTDAVSLAIGDYIEIFIATGTDASYTITNGTSLSFLAIDRLPEDSQIVVRGDITNVVVEAGGTPTGSLTNASATIWGTESRDTAAAYNSTTGSFTAPIPGDYCWNAGVNVGGTEASNNAMNLYPYLDGTILGRFYGETRVQAASLSAIQAQSNGCTYMNAGQVLTFRTDTNMTAPAFVAGGANYLSIRNDSGGLPKPFIPGSVFSQSLSNIRLDYADIEDNDTITTQSGTWITSVSSGATGLYTITFADAYTLAPACFANISSTSNGRCLAGTYTTSSVLIACRNTADSLIDADFELLCTGR